MRKAAHQFALSAAAALQQPAIDLPEQPGALHVAFSTLCESTSHRLQYRLRLSCGARLASVGQQADGVGSCTLSSSSSTWCTLCSLPELPNLWMLCMRVRADLQDGVLVRSAGHEIPARSGAPVPCRRCWQQQSSYVSRPHHMLPQTRTVVMICAQADGVSQGGMHVSDSLALYERILRL